MGGLYIAKMDRWSERDDDDSVQRGPQGRVAREGIGAFIKQDKGKISQLFLNSAVTLAVQGCAQV